MLNVNPKTGIAYGVISGSQVPDLVDDIQNKGVNRTLKVFQKEMVGKICDFIRSLPIKRYGADELIYDHLTTLDSIATIVPVEPFDEEDFTWKEGRFSFKLSYLGGAIKIWVLNGPYVTYARACSPCLPGAGDLDEPSADGTLLCYCLAPEDTPEELLKDMLVMEVDQASMPSGYKIVHKPGDT